MDRQQVEDELLDAKTRPEVEKALADAEAWLAANPAGPAARDIRSLMEQPERLLDAYAQGLIT